MRQTAINSRLGADAKSLAGSIQRESVVGTWFNTNRTSPEIAKVELTYSAEDMVIRVYGAENDATIDWGEAAVAPHASPDRPNEMTGFEAHFESAVVERHLAANLKLGVLVIQCYNRERDVEQGRSYFTREFFHQRIESFSEPFNGVAGDSSSLPYVKAGDCLENTADPLAVNVDLAPHLGTWRNTYQHTRGISHLELLRDGDGFLVHAHGVATERNWGAVSAVAYADGVGSRNPSGFFAKYDFGFIEMQLAANFNKGLLIVAAYNHFNDDSGRADYFTREFFYHQQPSAYAQDQNS